MEVKMYVFHGKGQHKDTIYAHLYEASSGDLVVSATADYCLKAVRERGWRIILA